MFLGEERPELAGIGDETGMQSVRPFRSNESKFAHTFTNCLLFLSLPSGCENLTLLLFRKTGVNCLCSSPPSFCFHLTTPNQCRLSLICILSFFQPSLHPSLLLGSKEQVVMWGLSAEPAAFSAVNQQWLSVVGPWSAPKQQDACL